MCGSAVRAAATWSYSYASSFIAWFVDPPDLHSFPTRRSSDLSARPLGGLTFGPPCGTFAPGHVGLRPPSNPGGEHGPALIPVHTRAPGRGGTAMHHFHGAGGTSVHAPVRHGVGFDRAYGQTVRGGHIIDERGVRDAARCRPYGAHNGRRPELRYRFPRWGHPLPGACQPEWPYGVCEQSGCGRGQVS